MPHPILNVTAVPSTNQPNFNDQTPAGGKAVEPMRAGGIGEVALRSMLRPVQKYLDDDAVREIAIPQPGVIFLRAKGVWIEKDAPELTFELLKALANAMASYNEGVNFSPIMSLKLLDGERGQVMLPPAVLEGTVSVNIRKHSSVVKTLDELASDGALDSYRNTNKKKQMDSADEQLLQLLEARQILQFLQSAVALRKNIVIGGKTGSGKTTFARSLIELVPTTERLITIEDVHELFLPRHRNKVHLIYGEGIGQPNASQCVAACMRSSPDRIFLSELRGPEAWDYLSALNTGHPGSITTTHANSARDVFNRVAMLIKQSIAGNQMDIDTLHDYLRSTLDIVLFYSEFKLAEVYFEPYRAATNN